MANRAVPLSAAALTLLLCLGPLWAAVSFGGVARGLTPADWGALRFTVVQAALSAAFSCILAVPVARALAMRRFPGRAALVTLLGVPFLLPVIVAVLGLLSVLGRSGYLAALTGWTPPIYGLQGVVLASVFLNLPLAVRLLLQGWLAVPPERYRLAASLGFSDWTVWRVIDWPVVRSVLPGAGLVIGLICLNSFAVALILGGGPRATTLELAIYQALRFEFAPDRAALLALVQAGLSGAALLVTARLSLPTDLGAGLDRPLQRWDRRGFAARLSDGVWIAGAALFLLLPLASVVIEGLSGLGDLTASTLWATLRSLAVALGATAICLPLALALAAARWAGWVAVLPLAISPLILGTGAFLLLRPVLSLTDWALPLTALSNALSALPFAYRSLAPDVAATRDSFGRLSASLGVTGLRYLWIVLLPRLRRPLGFAAGLTAALSMGDLGIVTVFAGQDETLPLHIYRLMGAYRSDAAASAALLLVALSLLLFWIFDRGGRHADI